MSFNVFSPRLSYLRLNCYLTPCLHSWVLILHCIPFIILSVVEVGPDGALKVELHKTSAGLGFSLEGGRASAQGDRPLHVKRIFKGNCLSSLNLHQENSKFYRVLHSFGDFSFYKNCVIVHARKYLVITRYILRLNHIH